MDLENKNSPVEESERKDSAQEFYGKKNEKIYYKENSNEHLIAIGLAVASFIPIISFFNFLFVYNIISIVLAVKVLKRGKNSNNSTERTVSILAIVISILNILFALLFLFFLIGFGTILNSY